MRNHSNLLQLVCLLFSFLDFIRKWPCICNICIFGQNCFCIFLIHLLLSPFIQSQLSSNSYLMYIVFILIYYISIYVGKYWFDFFNYFLIMYITHCCNLTSTINTCFTFYSQTSFYQPINASYSDVYFVDRVFWLHSFYSSKNLLNNFFNSKFSLKISFFKKCLPYTPPPSTLT